MDKQEMYKFIDNNKDMQMILKLIMKEKGTVEIKYNNGKISKKQKIVDF